MRSQQQPTNWYILFDRYGPFILFTIAILLLVRQAFSSDPGCDSASTRLIQDKSVPVRHLWTHCIVSYEEDQLRLHTNSVIMADDEQHKITSYAALSGESQWSFSYEGAPVYSPVLDLGRQRLYIDSSNGSMNHVYGLDLGTGALLWDQATSTNEVSYKPLLLADNRLVVIEQRERTARQVDPNQGLYSEPITLAASQVYSDGYAWNWPGGILTAYAAPTGAITWRANEANGQNSFLIDVQRNNALVLASYGDDLVAYDLATGRILWHTSELSMVGHPILRDRTIYALTRDAKLHALNAFTGTDLGFVQFEPAAPGRDGVLYDTEGISASQLVGNQHLIAIYFADTDQLSVYWIDDPL